MRRSLAGLTFVVSVATWAPLPAFAYGPNLLVDAGFDVNVLNWLQTSDVTWSATDSRGNAGSGSALLEFDQITGVYGPKQCVPASSGSKLVASASYWISSASHPLVTPYLLVRFHVASGCGAPLAPVAVEGTTLRNAWQTVSVIATPPPGAAYAEVLLGASNPQGAPAKVYLDNAFLGTGNCAASATTLCLNQGRFQVTVAWDTPQPSAGSGQAVPFAADSGSFWFFSPDNLELDVKVLNGCGLNNKYWVFIAGLTNVHVVLTVTDTKTGQVRTYASPQNQLFKTVADVAGFASCP